MFIVALPGTGAPLGGYRNIRMASLQQLRKFAIKERICGERMGDKATKLLYCKLSSWRVG